METTSSNIIEVAQLGIRLGGTDILHDLSFTVGSGEYLSIIGPNGAGKSTLIKCLAGIHRHWHGQIRIAGAPLLGYARRELARLVSYVPQADGRQLPFTVHEFVMMGRYPHLSPFTSCRPEDEKAVEEAMRLTGIGEFRNRMIDTLSGGERQNVHIAAALAQGARILLLDEPSTFLDYRHQVEIMRTIKSINRDSGITVIAISHDINAAVCWSNRLLALRDGRAVFQGSPAAILSGGTLGGIYDTSFRLIPDPQAKLPLVVAGGEI